MIDLEKESSYGDSPAAPAVPGHAILSLGQASPNDLVSRLGCL